MVLDAAPLPGLPAPEGPQAIDPPPTKKAALLALYRVHPEYGVRASASQGGGRAGAAGRASAGTARAYLYAELEAGRHDRLILAAVALVLGAGLFVRCTVFSGDRIRRDALADPAAHAPGPGVRLVRRAVVPLVAPCGDRPRPPGPARAEAAPPAGAPTTDYAVRLGRGQWFRRVYARLEDQVLIMAAPRTGK